MLVLLLGPSGVGKSTIANLLVQNSSWVPVISWLTRPERSDEQFKVSISPTSFDMLAKQGKLWSDVEQNGHRYGLLSSEVRQALDDPSRFYILDYSLPSWRKCFASEPNLPVYVASDDDATLRERLFRAGRPERIASAEQVRLELEAWHASTLNVPRIVNNEGRPEEAAAAVQAAAWAWAVNRAAVSSDIENCPPDDIQN